MVPDAWNDPAHTQRIAQRNRERDSLMTTIRIAKDHLDLAQEDLDRAVRAARSAQRVDPDTGCTWQAIGDVFGKTRQAAQDRFGHLGDDPLPLRKCQLRLQLIPPPPRPKPARRNRDQPIAFDPSGKPLYRDDVAW